MAKRKRKAVMREAAPKAFSAEAAMLHLESLVKVDFALAWEPKEGAFVIIQSVKVNGTEVTGAVGGTNSSPYHVSLGKYPAGAQLKIEWCVETYNELSGIAAYTQTSTTNAWKQLGQTKAPLGFKETWTASETFEVT